MVYTVTFNPALDYVVRLGQFRTGGVNRAGSEEIQFGGKGVNVSTVLRNLGVETVALGFLAGFTGRALQEGLERAGVRTDFIWLKEGMTRINVKIKAEEETDLNGRGPDIDLEALNQLMERLDGLEEDDFLVLAGSIPAALPDDIYERILARMEGQGVRTVVDATGALLRNALPYHPFLVKPNHIELGELVGEELTALEDLKAGAARIQEMGARNVLVSMAGNGSLLLDETGRFHQLGVPRGTVRNSVGAGDSMVAGFLAGWLSTGDYAAAHRMGAAAGSATAYSDGLATKEAVERLLDSF